MSKGLGAVQRKLASLFTDYPDRSFTIEELASEPYGRRVIGKRHRAAVIRAAKRVLKSRPQIVIKHAEAGRGHRLIFFNHRSLFSYAAARLKGDWPRGRTEAEAQWRLLHDEDCLQLIKPGGKWWCRVQEWIAEKDGDSARLAELKALPQASLADVLGSLLV
jgi:hypothetical protein